ncbi:hypothetical protein [Promicromonospora soli]|uniref:Uncharacterized protein n=1 Tax=Promicromonospora soli TaxID=2035533 RepID=A0A919G196_9MICO|nr:hypothetical protein [Promicromonospora soli]GHH76283.1 hypothetical protein GCM10017772_34530 [Promicromonospora soli]
MSNEEKSVKITPALAAGLAFAFIAAFYAPLITALVAVLTALFGRRFPWVLAGASVLVAWSLLMIFPAIIPGVYSLLPVFIR